MDPELPFNELFATFQYYSYVKFTGSYVNYSLPLKSKVNMSCFYPGKNFYNNLEKFYIGQMWMLIIKQSWKIKFLKCLLNTFFSRRSLSYKRQRNQSDWNGMQVWSKHRKFFMDMVRQKCRQTNRQTDKLTNKLH